MGTPTPPDRRARARLHSIEESTTRDARCLATVTVEALDGSLSEGNGEGPDTPGGRARAGAQAALEAAARITLERLELELRGVKLVRAFDAYLVIVALRARSPLKAYELIGSTATSEGDMVRGGTLAILDATNRILERYVNRPEGEPDEA